MSGFPSLSRRSFLEVVVAGSVLGAAPRASGSEMAGPSADGPGARRPKDRRLGPLKDLKGYFPFTPGASPEAWAGRAERVRRQILVASGLWPMPERPAVAAVVHGPVDREEYTVSRVSFESTPGLYVTGSLYRPKGRGGRRPGVLCPHGHWREGRFHRYNDREMERELDSRGELFGDGGRTPVQARCVHLARMGCVVFLYDMIGYADSAPITQAIAHGFRQQRPERSRLDRWGAFSAQAELRLQNVAGLQLWNSIRALDWLVGLPDVDAGRVGVTGSSGGATQTLLLVAVDPRPVVAFPAVMVSTAMQGGCTCENASYLRIDTGNVEFAALCAPRPLGMTGANDWTREIESKGLPELERHYAMLGAPGLVSGKYFDFGHNYNAPSRAMMYALLKEHLKFDDPAPTEERDYRPLTVEEQTVWDDEHPKPACDEEAEVELLESFDAASRRAIEALSPRDAASLAEYRAVIGGALDIMIGRGLPPAGAVEFAMLTEADRGEYRDCCALLREPAREEERPATFFYPKDWTKDVVLWIHEDGKAGLRDGAGEPIRLVRSLLGRGLAVAGIDLLYQGDYLENDKPLSQTRRVDNEREFLGYTVGYNHPLLAQRVHDILALISFVRHHEARTRRVTLVGLGGAAPWAALAGAVAGRAIDGLALATAGFRFATITDLRDPNLLPGAVKYGDLPGLLALAAPTPLWLSGEGVEAPGLVAACYHAAGGGPVSSYAGPAEGEADSLLAWIGRG